MLVEELSKSDNAQQVSNRVGTERIIGWDIFIKVFDTNVIRGE